MPSSTRCLARSRTEAGTSSSVVLATQLASRPVGPAGSVGGRGDFPGCRTVLGASEIAIAFSPFPLGISDVRLEMRLAQVPSQPLARAQRPQLSEAIMDNGLSVSDIWVLNTDSCGTSEFSAAVADITEAAGSHQDATSTTRLEG